MKKHTKIVIEFFGLGEQDCPVCEGCKRAQATDAHHVKSRGMGGNKSLDYIENLIFLCRDCHEKAHADQDFNNKLAKLAKLTVFRKWKMNQMMY